MSTTLRNGALALLAIVSLGATTLATSTPADAFGGFSRGGRGPMQHGMNHGGGRGAFHHNPVFAGHHGPSRCDFGRCNGHFPHRPHFSAPVYAPARYIQQGPAYVAPAPAYASPAPAPTQAQAPANCLKKEYTQDGQVIFSDVCTNEVLIGPAGTNQLEQAQQQPQDQAQVMPSGPVRR